MLPEECIQAPTWDQIVESIIRLDRFQYPYIVMYPSEYEDQGDELSIIGGKGAWTAGGGKWEYTNADGSNEEIELWESDQGYGCTMKHVMTDLDQVLDLAKQFYICPKHDQLDIG